MKEGTGVLQYVNGEKYEGQWKANFAHGQGTLTYADNDKYVGNWREGKKNGMGELYYVNGDKFRGDWEDDKACGIGLLEYANGDTYEGEWFNDQRHGDTIKFMNICTSNNLFEFRARKILFCCNRGYIHRRMDGRIKTWPRHNIFSNWGFIQCCLESRKN
jgi:hypothetical protein